MRLPAGVVDTIFVIGLQKLKSEGGWWWEKEPFWQVAVHGNNTGTFCKVIKKNSPGIVHGSNGDDIDAIAITLHQFPQGTFGMNVGRHHKGVGQQVH
jgi:hypothetical protein